MAFCTNCGHQLSDGAKFCFECGTKVDVRNITHTEERKTVYDGEIHKCPLCGEVMNSFAPTCPSCGYELRGAKASNSVHEFALRLEKAKSDDQRIVLIRNFPIPNTKEDIFEFMILAATNISNGYQKNINDAWLVKFEQCYKKAKLVFGNDQDFSGIKDIYEQTSKQLEKEKRIRSAKKIGHALFNAGPASPRIIVVIGWLISIFVLIPLCGVNTDNSGFNAYQLLLILDFVAGAIMIPRVVQCESNTPTFVALIGLILSILILIPLCKINLDNAGFSAYHLIIIADIIATIQIIRKVFQKNEP